MRRRDLLSGLGATGALTLAAAPFAAWAQAPGRTYRIAVWNIGRSRAELMPDGASAYRTIFAELARLGFVEGRNLVVDRYGSEGLTEQYAATAREIVDSKPDLISPNGTVPARVLKSLTTTIPIVVQAFGDPVADGLVVSLARPGSNITGFTLSDGIEIWGKRLELMTELLPSRQTFGCLETSGLGDKYRNVLESVGQRLKVRTEYFEMDAPYDEAGFTAMFARIGAARLDGLLVSTGIEFRANSVRFHRFAREARLPMMFGYPDEPEAGGLIGYGADVNDKDRRVAGYIARILNGDKPADLPVQQPTKYNLAINLKVAKELGIEVPLLLLARADEVIE